MNALAISVADALANGADKEEIARTIRFLNLLQQALKSYLE